MARIAAAEAAAAVAAGRAPPPPPAAVAADPEADAVHAARRREERDKRKAEKAAAAKVAKAAAKAAKAAAASRKRARSASPPPLRIVSAVDAAADAAPAPPPAQHWWSRLFHSAGAMLGAEHTARKERGFCEADQEALFMDAHGGKTEGRVGLGRRSDANPLKVGGARWAGNKVAFADADANAEGEEQAGVDGDHAAAAGALKWRKLAAATLAASPKGALKEKKLRKAVLAAAAAKLGWHGEAEGTPPDGGARALKAAFEAANPLSSSRFSRLPCGRVALADAGEDAQRGKKKSKKQERS
jgi:hypothetical protein